MFNKESRYVEKLIKPMKYIEFRVYLKDGVTDIEEVGDELQDKISDLVTSPDVPNIFTGDVTYELGEQKA